jgi:ABC-type transporter Mla subunit MlaD
LTHPAGPLKLPTGGCMKDIHEVLRQKQAKYAQLGKQIEMLQQAAEKLREVAPLLAENDDDDNGVLAEVDDATGQGDSMAAKAGASSGSSASKAARPTAPRWP